MTETGHRVQKIPPLEIKTRSSPRPWTRQLSHPRIHNTHTQITNIYIGIPSFACFPPPGSTWKIFLWEFGGATAAVSAIQHNHCLSDPSLPMLDLLLIPQDHPMPLRLFRFQTEAFQTNKSIHYLSNSLDLYVSISLPPTYWRGDTFSRCG